MDQGCGARQSELALDVFAVRFDGFEAQIQFRSYLSGAQAGPEKRWMVSMNWATWMGFDK